jgi:hypothetical protein
MDQTENPTLRRIAIAGIIVCLVPLVYELLWIYLFRLYETQAERVAHYKLFLPGVLEDPRVATWVFLAMSVLAIALSAIGLRQPNKVLWAFSLITIIIGSMLTLLLLWTMM